MTPQLNAIGLVTTDLAASLRFYRLLGLDIPEDVESRPHVEVVAGGVRLMWDTVEVVESLPRNFAGKLVRRALVSDVATEKPA